MPKLAELPPELLLEIVRQLPTATADIGNLRCTSRTFACLAHPLLYRCFRYETRSRPDSDGAEFRRGLEFLRLLKRRPRIAGLTTEAWMNWDALNDGKDPPPSHGDDAECILGGGWHYPYADAAAPDAAARCPQHPSHRAEHFAIWEATAAALGLAQQRHPLSFPGAPGAAPAAQHFALAGIAPLLVLAHLPQLRVLRVTTRGGAGPPPAAFVHPATGGALQIGRAHV